MVGFSPQSGALRIAAEAEFAEFHFERVEEEQAADERTALAEGEFQDFRGLDGADDAGQNAQDAAFGATGDHAGRRRFGIKAAVTRAVEMRREDAGLALEPEDRAVNVGLFEQDAGVVGEVAGGKIVRAIDDDVVLGRGFPGRFRW